MNVGLDLVFVHVFSILCAFLVHLSLFRSSVWFCLLGLVSSVLRQEIGWEERLRNALASPAMGHWGTCPPSTSNNLIFSTTFGAAESPTWTLYTLCAVAYPNMFVLCDSSCGSSVYYFVSFYVGQSLM